METAVKMMIPKKWMIT